jgi:hypothetical protein
VSFNLTLVFFRSAAACSIWIRFNVRHVGVYDCIADMEARKMPHTCWSKGSSNSEVSFQCNLLFTHESHPVDAIILNYTDTGWRRAIWWKCEGFGWAFTGLSQDQAKERVRKFPKLAIRLHLTTSQSRVNCYLNATCDYQQVICEFLDSIPCDLPRRSEVLAYPIPAVIGNFWKVQIMFTSATK